MKMIFIVSALCLLQACSSAPTSTHDSQPVQDISAKPRNQKDVDAEASVDPGDCKHTDTAFHCVKVMEVYDGDSFFIDLPGQHPLFGRRMGVRIASIDTPELKTHDDCEKRKAQEAKSVLEELFRKAKRIDLMDVEKDKFFRILATVHVDGKPVASELIKRGLGFPYHGERKVKRNWCH